MQEFTSDDFIRMQEQAIQRVKQMQQRSTSSENRPNNTIKQDQSTPKSSLDEDDVKIYEKLSKSQTNTAKTQPIKTQPSKQEPNFNTNTSTDKKQTDTIKLALPQTPKTKNQSQGILSAFLSMDNDMALILPLILLLGKEGADDILLLALLYILT